MLGLNNPPQFSNNVDPTVLYLSCRDETNNVGSNENKLSWIGKHFETSSNSETSIEISLQRMIERNVTEAVLVPSSSMFSDVASEKALKNLEAVLRKNPAARKINWRILSSYTENEDWIEMHSRNVSKEKPVIFVYLDIGKSKIRQNKDNYLESCERELRNRESREPERIN